MGKITKIFLILIAITACASVGWTEEHMEQAKSDSQDLKKATFAGGCFWCMEKPYESYEGIIRVICGYTGGKLENPTYG